MYILAIGASKNIGYLSSLRLLGEGHNVTFLLRKLSVFDEDPKMQAHVQAGRAKLIQGDATVKSDVQRALDEASINGQLDAVLLSVGGKPSFSPLRGFIINPPNLCCLSLYNVLLSIPEGTPASPQPKLVIVSANGVTKASHNALPLSVKLLFNCLGKSPHADKLAMERAAFHAANWAWLEANPKEMDAFLGLHWQKELRAPGFLKNLVIIRPTILTDGDDKPATGIYKATTEELRGAYSIARKEVSHFVVEGVLKHWDQWGGKVISITQ
ncbi:hypothetical protein K439DRAFT_1639858 [Ramaria rubella]|nr:hypothetical protein K439DRAFT_1639858 [Ramaria rubella]